MQKRKVPAMTGFKGSFAVMHIQKPFQLKERKCCRPVSYSSQRRSNKEMYQEMHSLICRMILQNIC